MRFFFHFTVGNSDPREPRLDLCFGGRRQFCGGSYVDFGKPSVCHQQRIYRACISVFELPVPEQDFILMHTQSLKHCSRKLQGTSHMPPATLHDIPKL